LDVVEAGGVVEAAAVVEAGADVVVGGAEVVVCVVEATADVVVDDTAALEVVVVVEAAAVDDDAPLLAPLVAAGIDVDESVIPTAAHACWPYVRPAWISDADVQVLWKQAATESWNALDVHRQFKSVAEHPPDDKPLL